MAELVSIKRNVDVSPGQAAPAVFHCSQGDVGSKIILGLLNNGTAYAIPSGVTVTIEGSESNGSIFTPISATASGSDITFYLTGEMTAVAGPAICQAVLKSGSNILGTANFTLEVESSPMGADAPPVFTDAGWTWMLNKLNTEFVPALGNETIIDAIGNLKTDLNYNKTATPGYVLKATDSGNGTEWSTIGLPTDEQTANAVNAWLNEHPEATTTVQDKAVTRNKLAQNITDFLPLEYIKTQFEKDGGETTVWYAIIPSEYKPKLRLANDTIDTVESATDNAGRNHSTITINAGIFYTQDAKTKGYVINNGDVLNDENYDDGTNLDYLYMTSDGVLNTIGPSKNVVISDLKALRPEWAFLGFYALVKNGAYVATGRGDDYYNPPRTFIGQDANGNYIVGVSSGRNEGEKGLSMIDIYNFCLNVANFTPYCLYNLDGGGSSAFVYKGTRISTLTQGENRKCANYLSFEKEAARLTNTFEAINVIDNKLIELERYLYNNVELMAKIPQKIISLSQTGISDCNDVIETSIYLCGERTGNFPINDYGFLISIRHNGKLCIQMAISKDYLFVREIYIDGDTIIPSQWISAIDKPSRSDSAVGDNVNGYIRYIKYGKVVALQSDFQVTATISANSTLATNLPKSFIGNQNGIAFSISKTCRLQISGGGVLTTLDEMQSGYYKTNLVYISE